MELGHTRYIVSFPHGTIMNLERGGRGEEPAQSQTFPLPDLIRLSEIFPVPAYL